MAEIGQQEVRLMANSFVTLTGLSISFADVIKAIFDKEPDFFKEYMEKGGRIKDDLLIPSSQMDEFSMRMSSHRNEQGEAEPLHFTVLEELEIPCSFNDPNAEVLLDGDGNPIKGPIPKFDDRGMPVYDEDGLVYQTEKVMGKDGAFHETPVTGNLYIKKMSRVVYCDGIDPKQQRFYQDTNTYVGNVIGEDERGNPIFEEKMADNNLERDSVSMGIDTRSGDPIYTRFDNREDVMELAADLGGTTLETKDFANAKIFTPQEQFLQIEQKWANREVVKVEGLTFAETVMMENVLAKEGINDYLIVYNEANPQKPYEIELDNQEMAKTTFGDAINTQEKLEAEMKMALAHPDIQKGIKEIDANGKFVSNYLAKNDISPNTIRQPILLFPTKEGRNQYIEISMNGDDLAYHLHGFDQIDKTAVLTSDYSRAELSAAMTSMGPYSIIEGTKATTRFKDILEQNGPEALKENYSKKYEQTSKVFESLDYISNEVTTAAGSSELKRTLAVTETERIPNSDKLISFTATEFEQNGNEQLSELASDKVDRMYEAINENKIHMSITPASVHVQTASHMLKDHEMFAIDDRTYGDAITLSESATAQEQSSYNESVYEDVEKNDIAPEEADVVPWDDYEPSPGDNWDDF